jgi:hypothetical protein
MAEHTKQTLRYGTLALTITLIESLMVAPVQASFVGVFHSPAAATTSSLQNYDRYDSAAPTLVRSLIEDVGGGQRINSTGRLRMLSQRITAAACYFSVGVAPEESKEVLLAAKSEFSTILTALTVGDESLGIIGPETRRKTLVQIEAVTAIWSEFDTALNGIVAGTDVDTNVAYISAHSDELLSAAVILTSEMVSEYSNPAEMTQAMAMTIDIAGRQRMLTQKIAKELCGVVNDNPAIGDTTKLQATIAMYETTLTALHDGMPEAGIAPPATPEIKSALEVAAADWAEIKVELARATGPGTLTPDEQGALFSRLSKNMAMMNEITKMYTAAAAATL